MRKGSTMSEGSFVLDDAADQRRRILKNNLSLINITTVVRIVGNRPMATWEGVDATWLQRTGVGGDERRSIAATYEEQPQED